MKLLNNRWFKAFVFTLIGILSGLIYYYMFNKDNALVFDINLLITILFSGLIGFFLSFPFSRCANGSCNIDRK